MQHGIALLELTSDQKFNLGVDKGFLVHANSMAEAAETGGIPRKLLASAPDVLVDESSDP